MNIPGIIETVEKQYKQILEEFFVSVYTEKSLSSHGIDHHRRVWNYSKELLELIPSENSAFTAQLCSELIIASYLHDIGMSIDPGAKHGGHSRDLCIQFLNQNNLPPADWHEVLEAVANHDNKDYASNRQVNELLTILSVADDLDAFGYTGIFRYSEIYLRRGIELEKIGFMIRENAEKRFNNFIQNFGYNTELVQKHQKRYTILDNFFSKYNDHLPSYHFGIKNPAGFCGVVEIILFMMNNGLQLKDIFIDPKRFSSDKIIHWFFSELEKELIPKDANKFILGF